LYLAKAMSALETTLRVNSENQTLILAGEPVPRRPLTLVATPVANPMLIVQGGFQELGMEFTGSPQSIALSNRFTDRGSAFNAVSAYTRTQQLSVGSARTAIIDTYA
jgi:hypothetical protein